MHQGCLQSANSKTPVVPEEINLDSIPPQYHDLAPVFSKPGRSLVITSPQTIRLRN